MDITASREVRRKWCHHEKHSSKTKPLCRREGGGAGAGWGRGAWLLRRSCYRGKVVNVIYWCHQWLSFTWQLTGVPAASDWGHCMTDKNGVRPIVSHIDNRPASVFIYLFIYLFIYFTPSVSGIWFAYHWSLFVNFNLVCRLLIVVRLSALWTTRQTLCKVLCSYFSYNWPI